MGTITLIRHGQANSAAQDEASYDRLSELGIQQATWLGEWMRAQGHSYDRVLAGTLKRHAQTATAMGFPAFEPDARFNEMDYLNLAHALRELTGEYVTDGSEFAAHLPKVMHAWYAAEIMGNETFESFERRVWDGLQTAAEPGVHVLCVTSGGVIAMIIRHLLGLDIDRLAQIAVPIFNTSMHHIHVTPNGQLLAGFNTIPHLQAQERADARTHY